MDVDNDSHAPVKAVQLRSADGRYLLEFVLKPLSEPKHQNWHSYELHMTDIKNRKKASLMSTEEHTLFLDKVIEPEIPALSAGLRRAATTGEPYTFEPVDERDFRLDLAEETSGIRLKIQYESASASGEYGWPAGVIVDKADLIRFANDLESIFRDEIVKVNL